MRPNERQPRICFLLFCAEVSLNLKPQHPKPARFTSHVLSELAGCGRMINLLPTLVLYITLHTPLELRSPVIREYPGNLGDPLYDLRCMCCVYIFMH